MKFLFNMFRGSRKQQAASKPRARRPARPVPRTAQAGVSNVATRPAVAAPVDPLDQARRDAAHAVKEVTEISHAHLATLMALPPRARFSHLADLELTPADKSALENSVCSLLPRSTAAKSPAWNPASSLRRLLPRCGYKWIATIIVLAICSLAAGIAWRNTGEWLIVSNETWWVDWNLPDGSHLHGGWKAGSPVIAMRPRNGRVTLRYWLAGHGYATTEVDQDWLIKHSFDYVVAPTGATGVVNPANRGSL